MRPTFLLPLFLLLFLAALPARAATESAWQEQPEVSARLVAGTTAVSGPTVPLGLELRLAPHWKTYWRTPGAAGFPVTLAWEGSTNLDHTQLSWPAPQRFTVSDMETFGYQDDVLLPITATVADPAQPLHLAAALSLMVCSEVCIPYDFTLALDLPAGPAEPSFHAGDLALWQSRVPGPPEAAGLTFERATFQNNQLMVVLTANPPLTHPDLLVEAPGQQVFEAPTRTTGAPTILTAQLSPDSDTEGLVPGATLTLTVLDGKRKAEQTLKLSPPEPPLNSAPPPLIHTVHLLTMLLTALFGGLILNLMPCVLPVLSLKLLSAIHHANAPPAHVRLSFLSSAAGILFSFLLLAGGIIALKEGGAAVGWGMQFQEPAFLVFMIALLTLFAAAMWDFIHIPLPRFLADAINDRLPLPGEHDRTLVGNFITGAFATLLATPCTAPFVGTAIGFALAGSALDILLIFIALGIGLATPYLLIATFPSLARHLPKPGCWMGLLRALLGFTLLGTALWLVFVLQAEWGQERASQVGGVAMLVLFVLWIRAAIKRPRLLLTGSVALALALAFAFTVPDKLLRQSPGATTIHWQPFDQAAIPGLLAKGMVVFVDVTADWCLTCKANERLVLNRPDIVTLLNDPQIVALRADWTRRDPEIAAYLRSFGRYGIPFNAFYGPAAPKGLALPEVLSENALTTALTEVKGQPHENRTTEPR